MVAFVGRCLEELITQFLNGIITRGIAFRCNADEGDGTDCKPPALFNTAKLGTAFS